MKIEKLKELWKNKRYRSIIILGFYIVFFALVFISVDNKKEVITDKYQQIKNKKYSYTINNGSTEKVEELDMLNDLSTIIKNSTLESTNYLNDSNTYIYNEYKIIIYGKEKISKIEIIKDDLKIEVNYKEN